MVCMCSGVRNLFKYSKYYSGQEPEFAGETAACENGSRGDDETGTAGSAGFL